jgi:pimeloyl-ACP methyl ester carboxylesterase
MSRPRRVLLLATVAIFLISILTSCVLPPTEPSGGAGSATDAEGGAETQGEAGRQSTGRSIDIGGGRTLFVECKGEGSPTVILESGIHDSSEYWANVQLTPPAAGPDVFTAVAEHTRACRYDRPGTLIPGERATITDRSTAVPNPRTIDQVSADLDALIRVAGLRGPFLLVGHSFGGWLHTYYSQTRAENVAGLVLVDAFSARMPEFMGDKYRPYDVVLNGLPGNPLSEDPGFEQFDVLASVRLAEAAPPLRQDLPMVVLSKTLPFPLPANLEGFTSADVEAAWTKVQAALAKLVPNTPHIIADGSDHYIQVREPDLVTSAIVLILERIRAEE